VPEKSGIRKEKSHPPASTAIDSYSRVISKFNAGISWYCTYKQWYRNDWWINKSVSAWIDIGNASRAVTVRLNFVFNSILS
jgi:hypothetical protein